MKRIRSHTLVAFALIPVLAHAHAHLKSSTPTDGAVLAQSPPSIMLMFSEATRLTALTLKSRDGEVDTKLSPLPAEANAHLEVPVPKLAAGAYTLQWRALGKDNHVISGTLRFTVGADAKTSGESRSSTPTTHDPHSH
jgi:methionine-rich copper-binding protein CopC